MSARSAASTSSARTPAKQLPGSINVTSVQDAPTLNGADNLAAINEDATNSGGTLVSSLISGGRATDPDAGALGGIAVTAWDNTRLCCRSSS